MSRIYENPYQAIYEELRDLNATAKIILTAITRAAKAPEPEVPEAVKDLLCAGADTDKEAYFRPDIYNERIIEAYHRGLGSNRSAQKAR